MTGSYINRIRCNILPNFIDFEFWLCYKDNTKKASFRIAVKLSRKNIFYLLSVLLFVLSLPGLASDQVLLKNARIFSLGESGLLDNGMILIRNGKIEKIGPNIPVPSDAQVIDLLGKTIIPGIVCASSSLFLEEQDLQYSGEENPDTDILEGIHYFDPSISRIHKHGITTVYISPVSFRSIGGLGAVVKAVCEESGKMQILKEKAALNIRLDRLQNKETSNVLRLTQYLAIRDRFMQAREYRKTWTDFDKKQKKYDEEMEKLGDKKEKKPSAEKKPKKPEKPGRNESKEILLQAMDKKIPVRFIVHRPDSIFQALRLGEEFGLTVILEGAEDWPQLLPELKEASVSLLSNPLLDYRRSLLPGGAKGYAAERLGVKDSDLFYSDKESVHERKTEESQWGKLTDSGIPFALIPADRLPLSARFMRFYAAFLSSCGVSNEHALGAVTLNAANILGVADRVGSLDTGKDADLVVLDGNPLDSLAKIEMVLIDGKTVWMRK